MAHCTTVQELSTQIFTEVKVASLKCEITLFQVKVLHSKYNIFLTFIQGQFTKGNALFLRNALIPFTKLHIHTRRLLSRTKV